MDPGRESERAKMKARLNLSTKPLQTHRRFLATAGIVGVVAGLFFLGLGWHVYSVRRADAALRDKVESIRVEMVSLEQQRSDLEQFFNRPENAKLHERSAFLNTIIDEQSLNWTQMFMDLEKILPAGVRVVSIQPKHEKGRVEVKLVIGATNDEAKLKFLHALEKSPSFTSVQLVNEKIASTSPGSTDLVDIELTAVYSRT
jgi:type IV pilus assembly protein PilN